MIKKLFAKLALLITVLSLLTATNPLITYAEEESLAGIMADLGVGENACFEPEDAYNITIIEEPLLWDEQVKKDSEGKTSFETRLCYRNTVNYKEERVEKTVSEYSKTCSDKLRTRAANSKGAIIYSCEEVMVLFSTGGTTLIEGYITTIYKWGAGLGGIIAVMVIIIGGIKISASGGEPQGVEEAKKLIFKSLLGLAVLFLSGLILYTINPTFFTR